MVETIGRTIRLNTGYDQALEAVEAALKPEGFGVLTRIDVQDTLKKKLGVDFRRYAILGACNPNLAHRALTIAPESGLLLPCNVTVAEGEDGIVEVSLIDPMAMLGVLHSPALEPIAEEARERLERVAMRLQENESVS
ncbi:MAG TPA: DUF302 domain-containing protein [Aggregatilinea sp.]|uniref:DUF302 domain-containing protein n=1 Tax=Aggregatilinea sp. TaxID=2806333 RepID=UPI002B678E5B|nr:DUF302 domain-containing protein [Aggregatilinea sp.]HML20866.1 DUF302 domain-containing protein [Aggregatilinea sp.]